MIYRYFVKPGLDFIVAFNGFILMLPIFTFLVVLLGIINKGNPFFVQRRPGRDGTIFNIIKFKTMADRKDKSGNFLPDADRLTLIGSLVRKASLDEIPQLLNVIMGDMSLIGPRPLLVEYLSLYNKKQYRRHEVKPGITGWAQVNGRNAISWEQKFDYDVWYVDHISFRLDCYIFYKTILKVFNREGVSQKGHVTMTKFKGSVNGISHRS